MFSKIFEGVLNKQIASHFESNSLFANCQYGFRSKRTTTMAVSCLVRNVIDGFENHMDTSATFYDLTRAFDCVSHDILLDKLKVYSFSNAAVNMVRSYIADRRQFVMYGGDVSVQEPIHYGVPQGSVLGPTLFLVYINDLVNFQNNTHLIQFADDTTTFETYHPSTDVEHVVGSTRSNIERWFQANKLSLNPSKTQNITFSLRQYRERDPVKFLGVYVDAALSWEAHVDHLCRKLSKNIYLIRNLHDSVFTDTVLSAYYAHFHSNMTYSLLNWGHSPHSKRVFGLQRRCIRILCGLKYRECCRESFRQLKVLTLPGEYIYQCLLYIRTNLGMFTVHSDVHNYPTRGRDGVRADYFRLLRSRGGTTYHCVKCYNALPERVKSYDFTKFKTTIKSYLRESAFYDVDEFLQSDFSEI